MGLQSSERLQVLSTLLDLGNLSLCGGGGASIGAEVLQAQATPMLNMLPGFELEVGYKRSQWYLGEMAFKEESQTI